MPVVAEGILPLAKAPGWRDGLWDLDSPDSLLEIAYNRSAADRAWGENAPADLRDATGMPERHGVYGSLDDVNYESHAVVVWSSGESGSCPEWLFDVKTVGGRVELEIRIAAEITGEVDEPGFGCTDDYNGYRMLLAVPRERLPNPADLPFEEPREGAPGEDWPWLRVVEYPT